MAARRRSRPEADDVRHDLVTDLSADEIPAMDDDFRRLLESTRAAVHAPDGGDFDERVRARYTES